MSGKFVRPIGLVLFAGLMSAPLLAATPAEMVKGRIANFHELGTAFKNLNDELKKETPTSYFIQLQAREINNYAKQISGWFPAGSDATTGVKTKAKPEIWAQPAQFKAAQDAFATQAQTMMDVAGTGEIEKMQAQSKALAATCAACHRTFRSE